MAEKVEQTRHRLSDPCALARPAGRIANAGELRRKLGHQGDPFRLGKLGSLFERVHGVPAGGLVAPSRVRERSGWLLGAKANRSTEGRAPRVRGAAGLKRPVQRKRSMVQIQCASRMPMRIGIDFDNTLIGYDDV